MVTLYLTYVLNMKCHSLSYDIFNANMTLFEMSLLRLHNLS